MFRAPGFAAARWPRRGSPDGSVLAGLLRGSRLKAEGRTRSLVPDVKGLCQPKGRKKEPGQWERGPG